MWEEIKIQEKMSLCVDAVDKRVTLCLQSANTALAAPNRIELERADLTELISALLSINRCFQGEKAYFEE